MKKAFLFLFLSIFLFSCSLTSSRNKVSNGQKQGLDETTQPAKPTQTATDAPTLTPTTKPSPTEEPQSPSLESIHIGGIFYAPITLLYDPNKWTIGENEFDKTLELKNNPGCKIYENIPRGLPGHSLEAETLEEKMGPYNLTLTKFTSDGEIYYAIFNFYEENISIAVEPWCDDPANCYDAAWSVIENSANNDFGPME